MTLDTPERLDGAAWCLFSLEAGLNGYGGKPVHLRGMNWSRMAQTVVIAQATKSAAEFREVWRMITGESCTPHGLP